MQPEPFTLNVPDSGDRRSARAARADPVSRSGARPRVGLRHRCGLRAGAGRVLAGRSFDWRAQEARLNAFPQYKVPLHGIDLHFLHVPGQGPNPCPLLLLHGWPGSVFEFLDMIPRLTDPARFGGDPADAFTVIAPSLPGYGLSFRPGQTRFGVEEIADCVADLMTERARLSTLRRPGRRLGRVHRLAAWLCPPGPADRHPPQPADRPPRPAAVARPDGRGERAIPTSWRLAEGGDRLSVDPGHPAADPGLRADRFAGRPRRLDRREIPRLVRLRRRCRERVHEATSCSPTSHSTGSPAPSAPRSGPTTRGCTGPGRSRTARTVDVPTGYAAFPAEIVRPPRSLAARTYTDIRRWTAMQRAGTSRRWSSPARWREEVAGLLPSATGIEGRRFSGPASLGRGRKRKREHLARVGLHYRGERHMSARVQVQPGAARRAPEPVAGRPARPRSRTPVPSPGAGATTVAWRTASRGEIRGLARRGRKACRSHRASGSSRGSAGPARTNCQPRTATCRHRPAAPGGNAPARCLLRRAAAGPPAGAASPHRARGGRRPGSGARRCAPHHRSSVRVALGWLSRSAFSVSSKARSSTRVKPLSGQAGGAAPPSSDPASGTRMRRGIRRIGPDTPHGWQEAENHSPGGRSVAPQTVMRAAPWARSASSVPGNPGSSSRPTSATTKAQGATQPAARSRCNAKDASPRP